MDSVRFEEVREYHDAVNGIINIRNLYRGLTTYNVVYYEGIGGLKQLLTTINNFYMRQLSGIQDCDNLISELEQVLIQIPEEVRFSGVIDKEAYRIQILEIIRTVEVFDEKVKGIFSYWSLYKFYNNTFQANTLIHSVNSLYKPEVWDFIPEDSRLDIGEAARGLLVHIPTRASFLFLRALEGCIRKLCEFIGEEVDGHTFGALLHKIETYFNRLDLDDKVKARVKRQIKFMRYLKDEFRNPAAHPEKTFEQAEAEQLFQVVNVGINRIYDLFLIASEANVS